MADARTDVIPTLTGRLVSTHQRIGLRASAYLRFGSLPSSRPGPAPETPPNIVVAVSDPTPAEVVERLAAYRSDHHAIEAGELLDWLFRGVVADTLSRFTDLGTIHPDDIGRYHLDFVRDLISYWGGPDPREAPKWSPGDESPADDAALRSAWLDILANCWRSVSVRQAEAAEPPLPVEETAAATVEPPTATKARLAELPMVEPPPPSQPPPLSPAPDHSWMVVELRKSKKPIQAALLEYMIDRETADFDAVKHAVHGADDVEDNTVTQNAIRTTNSLRDLGSKLEIKTAAGMVYLYDAPE